MSFSRTLNHFVSFDQLAIRDSVIHRRHSVVKMWSTFFFIVAVMSLPAEKLVAHLFFGALLMSGIILSRTPVRPLARRWLLALPPIIIIAIGASWYNSAPVIVYGLPISSGILTGVSLLLKTTLTIFAALLLTATTPFTEIGGELTRGGVPKIFGLQLVMTYRYLTTLLNEITALRTAHQLRSVAENKIRLLNWSNICGQLLTRSIDRAERVYQAMLCRGFTGEFVCKKSSGFTRSDFIFLFIAGALIGLLRWTNW